MKPVWKLSMGPGAGGNEFPDLAAVTARLDEGYVLVWGPTGPLGRSNYSQGRLFQLAANDDLFYLCHGNEEPGIMLVGQFSGPYEPDVPRPAGYRTKWFRRPFTTLARTATTARYSGTQRWWTPNHNSTFVRIPDCDMETFEAEILKPYFKRTLKWLARH